MLGNINNKKYTTLDSINKKRKLASVLKINVDAKVERPTIQIDSPAHAASNGFKGNQQISGVPNTGLSN